MSLKSANPWDRQEGEPVGAFAHFEHWLRNKYARGVHKTPTRSLSGSAEAMGVVLRVFNLQSAEWKWNDRALAYDSYISSIKAKEEKDEIAAMHRRHLKLARLMQTKASDVLQAVDPEEVSPNAAVGMAEAGVKIERLTRGEATDRTAVQDDLDLSKLDDDELAVLAALREKAKR